MNDDQVNFQQIPWEELRKLLRHIAPEIRRLAERGDKLAQDVYNRYCECAHNRLPLNHPTVASLRQAMHDYMYRDLTVSDRVELGSKFGHLVPEEQGPKPIQIVVSEAPKRKQ